MDLFFVTEHQNVARSEEYQIGRMHGFPSGGLPLYSICLCGCIPGGKRLPLYSYVVAKLSVEGLTSSYRYPQTLPESTSGDLFGSTHHPPRLPAESVPDQARKAEGVHPLQFGAVDGWDGLVRAPNHALHQLLDIPGGGGTTHMVAA